MPKIRLPDGAVKEFPAPVTVAEIASSIGPGLAKAALAGRVDGKLVDTSHALAGDADVAIVTDKDPAGLEVLRHSTAHLLAYAVKELFPDGPVSDVLARLPDRDYEGPGYIQHRKLGPRDLYAVYNAPKGAACSFRATGTAELWDPWTGTKRPLAVTSQTEERTTLTLPLMEKEIQLVVFTPGQPVLAQPESPQRYRPCAFLCGLPHCYRGLAG